MTGLLWFILYYLPPLSHFFKMQNFRVQRWYVWCLLLLCDLFCKLISFALISKFCKCFLRSQWSAISPVIVLSCFLLIFRTSSAISLVDCNRSSWCIRVSLICYNFLCVFTSYSLERCLLSLFRLNQYWFQSCKKLVISIFNNWALSLPVISMCSDVHSRITL